MSWVSRLYRSPLTAVQKTQVQLCSSVLAADGCWLRHSLQNTSGPSSGFTPASAALGDISPASWFEVGLRLAMVKQGMQGGKDGRDQDAPKPSAGDCEELQTCSIFLKAETSFIAIVCCYSSCYRCRESRQHDTPLLETCRVLWPVAY